MHFQLTVYHHLHRMHAEKLHLQMRSVRAHKFIFNSKESKFLKQEKISLKFGCLPCKCSAQSLAAVSPAPQIPSPSEPNSLCALGSLLQINSLRTRKTYFIEGKCETQTKKKTTKGTLKAKISQQRDFFSYLHSWMDLSVCKSAYMHL